GLHTEAQRLTACRIGLLPSPTARAWSAGVTSWQAASVWSSPLKLMIAAGVSRGGDNSGVVAPAAPVAAPLCAAACAFIAANSLSETGLRGAGIRCSPDRVLAVATGNWLRVTERAGAI